MDLVLDLGNFRLKGALFENDRLVDVFSSDLKGAKLNFPPADKALIASDNPQYEPILCKALGDISYAILGSAKLNVEKPEGTSQSQIASVYGALYHFPQNDCVVVNLCETITFDYISCSGSLLGGSHIIQDFAPAKRVATVAKSTEERVQSGLYYGLLGAVERITFEMRTTSENPSNVKVVATGDLLHRIEGFENDLSDLVDLIDPHLTLVGIHEIMKEVDKNV